MDKIRILLAEDHLVVRNGIKLLLDSQSNFHVVGEVSNGLEALEWLEKPDPGVDILITDLGMQDGDGLTLLQDLVDRQVGMNTIVLTMMDCDLHVLKCFSLGAKAYLVKNVSAEELIFCVNHVYNGGRYLCEELMMKIINKMIDRSADEVDKKDLGDLDLSERELEVLDLLGRGLTNQEIADELFLSKRTVEGHRQNLIDKTNSKNTPSLIRFAVINGLIK